MNDGWPRSRPYVIGSVDAPENERHDPSLDLAYRIAAALEVPVEQGFPNPHQTRNSQ